LRGGESATRLGGVNSISDLGIRDLLQVRDQPGHAPCFGSTVGVFLPRAPTLRRPPPEKNNITITAASEAG
jgi:hypothetical protein